MGEGRKRGFLLWAVQCLLTCGMAQNWGRLIYGPKVVRAVGTAHTESWFSEVADERVCKPLYNLNRTLQPIIEAVSRCPNPHKTLRQVNPEHIIWTRVHKKNGRKPVDPTDRSPRSPGNHADVPHSSPGADGDDQPGQGLTSDRLEGRPVVGQPGHLMAFLLVLGGDHFSDQLVALTAALAPAFPHVVWLQGDGQLFSSLAAQMSLKGYPQLLLFEDGLLKTRYRGRRRLSSLIEFFVENTGALPVTHVQAARVPRMPVEPDGWFYVSLFMVIAQMCICITGCRRSSRCAEVGGVTTATGGAGLPHGRREE